MGHADRAGGRMGEYYVKGPERDLAPAYPYTFLAHGTRDDQTDRNGDAEHHLARRS